jgi:hypothetical protein
VHVVRTTFSVALKTAYATYHKTERPSHDMLHDSDDDTAIPHPGAGTDVKFKKQKTIKPTSDDEEEDSDASTEDKTLSALQKKKQQKHEQLQLTGMMTQRQGQHTRGLGLMDVDESGGTNDREEHEADTEHIMCDAVHELKHDNTGGNKENELPNLSRSTSAASNISHGRATSTVITSPTAKRGRSQSQTPPANTDDSDDAGSRSGSNKAKKGKAVSVKKHKTDSSKLETKTMEHADTDEEVPVIHRSVRGGKHAHMGKTCFAKVNKGGMGWCMPIWADQLQARV